MPKDSYMLKVVNIIGARPNFMKIAPVHQKMINSELIKPTLIHTGQHYDEKMSKTFFIDLGMPKPDIYLGVGSGSHAEQTAAIMIELEKHFLELKPDWVVVVGDVNSTLAASLVASKLHIPIAHIEAGLRSFDRSMPEEINRILTDTLSELLFVTEKSGLENLQQEGISSDKIHLVGNVMIDSLIRHLKASESIDISAIIIKRDLNTFGLMTLHRPSNVDVQSTFSGILDAIECIQEEIPLVFPIHPRTRKMIEVFDFQERIAKMNQLFIIEPLGYLAFLRLMSTATLILTDSGGIQEETTFLGIPCITLRNNTERPVTCEMGTNTLVGTDTDHILTASKDALNNSKKHFKIPPYWDGKTSERIINEFEKCAGKRV